MVNARQTPILASPSANIAGSQTNRFITASYLPLWPRLWNRLLHEIEDRRRGASMSLRKFRGAPLFGDGRRDQRFRLFPAMFRRCQLARIAVSLPY
jgi:hypothetical protein